MSSRWHPSQIILLTSQSSHRSHWIFLTGDSFMKINNNNNAVWFSTAKASSELNSPSVENCGPFQIVGVLYFPHLLQSDALLACMDDHILGALGQERHRASCVWTTAAQRPCKMTSRKMGLIMTVTARAIIFCQISHCIGGRGREKNLQKYILRCHRTIHPSTLLA